MPGNTKKNRSATRRATAKRRASAAARRQSVSQDLRAAAPRADGDKAGIAPRRRRKPFVL